MSARKRQKTEVRVFSAFHYDVAYRKTYRGYLERSFRAIDAGLAMLEKHPRFVFAIEQVILVREYLSRYPAMKAAMARFAREGRLVFAPGMFTMPDVNIPSGENFCRNFRLGRDWLAGHIGVEPRICWMADIFGHHPQMPQLAGLCGYGTYLFERGKKDGEDTLFFWEGIDGSRVLTQWQADTYSGAAIAFNPLFQQRGPARAARFTEREILDPLCENAAVKSFIVSALGGDFRVPREEFFGLIESFNRHSSRYEMIFYPPEKAFAEIASRHAGCLPVLRCDFNPLMQGCYASRIRLKQYGREMETLAGALETLEAMAGGAGAADRLWEKAAVNAFHDIICGSLADDACREALGDCEQALGEGRAALSENMAALPGGKDCPAGEDLFVSVFNPLPYPRTESLELDLKVPGSGRTGVTLSGPDGERCPVQVAESESGRAVGELDLLGRPVAGDPAARAPEPRSLRVVASLTLPPTAVKTFGLKLSGPAGKKSGPFPSAGPRRLENRFLRVRLAENGLITSLYDKENGFEFVPTARGGAAVAGMHNIMRQPDHGDPWIYYAGPVNGSLLHAAEEHDPMPASGASLQRFGQRRTRAHDAGLAALPAIRVLENGPVRACLEVAGADPHLAYRALISLDAEEKMVRFRTRFIPRGKRFRVRVAFPSVIAGGRIVHSIPFGSIARGEGEYPAQNWLEYSDGERGLCLVNRGLPGNNVTGGVLMLSLFRAVAMEDEGDNGRWFEEGEPHVFEYALRPFGAKETIPYDPARAGEMFNRPFLAAFPPGRGRLPGHPGLVALKRGRAEMTCLRRRGKALEVRLYETGGRGTRAVLAFSRAVRACRAVDLRGRAAGEPAVPNGREVSLALKPHQVVTLEVETG